MALIAESAVNTAVCFMGTTTLTFLIGICWLMSALIKDIVNDLIQFNKQRKFKNRQKVKVKECFGKIVRDVKDVKELSEFSIFEIF